MSAKEMKPKKLPIRRCLGCGQSLPKRELLRVVRSPEGAVSLDFTGKKSGRGAYICKKVECFRRAAKANRFKVNLDCDIPAELLCALEEEIRRYEAEASDE